MRQVDLRSDTVTFPTPEMRRAMFEAEIGDDVYGEDPSVNKLEAMAAERLGKEAAVYVASGTMGNLVSVLAHAADIPVHKDGARVFNAAVALEAPVSELARDVDSITFCLSKGLACPVGSIICGTEEYIAQARKWRKIVGGSMRQAGIIAAAGIVALDTMVDRMADDHANARKLANGLNDIDGISIEPDRLPTNLVFFEIDHPDRAGFARKLNERGVLGGGSQRRWRYVTHYGITEDDVDYTLDVFETTYRETTS